MTFVSQPPRPETTAVERLVRRDRLIVAGGLVALTVLSWLFVLSGAGTGMSVAAMTTWQFPPPVRPGLAAGWSVHYWLIMLAMWWVMMVAMMVPSAAPMILLYARVVRHGQRKGQIDAAVVPTAVFGLGYLTAWFGFSTAAVLLQWCLEQVGLMHMMKMWSVNKWLTGALLVAAGLYQLSSLKQVCLHHCRTPMEFLSQHFRPGRLGALRMGIGHGLYCVGCCWVLMALLFAGGIMNLVWVAGLAIFVLIEKLAPIGPVVARATGVVLLAGGGMVMATV